MKRTTLLGWCVWCGESTLLRFCCQDCRRALKYLRTINPPDVDLRIKEQE